MPSGFGLLIEIITTQYMKPHLFFVLPLCLTFCSSDITIHDKYNFGKPAEVVELPVELTEVSGISYVSGNMIACVEDEDAIIYFFDLSTKKIIEQFRFGQQGDYEDLVVSGTDVYVLKSNGTVIHVNIKNESDREEYQTGLPSQYDSEGLCLDKQNNRLLIACKSGTGKKGGGDRYIYAFDLESKKISETPVIAFSGKEIDTFINAHEKDLPKSITSLRKEEKMDQLLSPSGIAIHPRTSELYVLSARSKILLVSDLKGKIMNIVSLDKQLFNQPEGITFTPEAKLYISNEGKKEPANIIGFEYAL
jgi:DNA-binding beta-propeller fold protein YncE